MVSVVFHTLADQRGGRRRRRVGRRRQGVDKGLGDSKHQRDIRRGGAKFACNQRLQLLHKGDGFKQPGLVVGGRRQSVQCCLGRIEAGDQVLHQHEVIRARCGRASLVLLRGGIQGQHASVDIGFHLVERYARGGRTATATSDQ